MTDKPRISWNTIFFRSGTVAAVAAVAASLGLADATLLLAALFGLGFIAGLWSRRHGWLAGLVVGLPSSFLQMARWAGADAGTPDWWRLAGPSALAATGMAVLGGMTGAWLRDMRLLR